MPGIPRSKGCRSCKIRRIKCDENWPACSQCVLRGYDCPGPTSLVKFITDGNHKNSRSELYVERGDASTSWVSEVCARPKGSTQSPEPECPDKRRRPANIAAIPAAHLTCFRLPSKVRPLPTTVTDRLAAQLVSHLNRASDRGMILSKTYLQYIPSRLGYFPCLRDTIALFCTVWSNFRRGRQSLDFINLPAYGKAIRSLRRALGTQQAFAVETLAAVTILQRTEELFNPGGQRMIHDQGMTTLLENIGPPESGDEFHISVLCEDYSILVPYWIMSGWKNIMNESPFRTPIIEGFARYTENKRFAPLVQAAFHRFDAVTKALPVLIRACESLWKPSNGEFQDSSSIYITNCFKEAHEVAEGIMTKFLEGALATGDIKEKVDEASLCETSYYFSTIYLAQIFLGLTSVHICIVRMRYDWSAAHGLPETRSIYSKLRELSEHVWKYARFLRSVESFIGVTSQRSLYLTLEVAGADEKEYLLDLISDMDSFRRRLPVQRDDLEAQILMYARLLTGRKP
ncbi:unnamed protein product [Clonostachys byssicola]|uniref:Zn(2)-C6 fungal-type domain-containing protein n=1 Tax=Clonostachys byssicola TaxID=160290 RepID=A0A9N9XZ92_9HYPO|nr:unnamed protein product [Clonostachys byssicola]